MTRVHLPGSNTLVKLLLYVALLLYLSLLWDVRTNMAAVAVAPSGRSCVIGKRIYIVRGRVWGRGRAHAWLAVPDQNWDSHAPGRLHGLKLQRFILSLAFTLVAPVLEPNLYLRGCQLEQGRHLFTLWGGQVALLLEPPFQLVHLRLRKENSWFPLLTLLHNSAVSSRRVMG